MPSPTAVHPDCQNPSCRSVEYPDRCSLCKGYQDFMFPNKSAEINPGTLAYYRKMALITEPLHSILNDVSVYMRSPDGSIEQTIANADVLHMALPILREILRQNKAVTIKEKESVAEFLNYLEALTDQFEEEPWKD